MALAQRGQFLLLKKYNSVCNEQLIHLEQERVFAIINVKVRQDFSFR